MNTEHKEVISMIALSMLRDFEDHPSSIRDDESMQQTKVLNKKPVIQKLTGFLLRFSLSGNQS